MTLPGRYGGAVLLLVILIPTAGPSCTSHDGGTNQGTRVGVVTPGSVANADQSDLAPDRIIGSAVIDLPRAFLLVAREVAAGTLVPQVRSFGLASGVISYRPNPAATRALPPGLGEWMDAVRGSIITGTLLPLTAPAGDAR